MSVEYRKPINNPYKIVKDFEDEVANYTGAKFAISVDNCTNAIFLVCKYLNVKEVTIPSKTYLSVPQSIIHAGGEVIFDKTSETNNWKGIYQLKPYQIYDSAKRFTSNMYIPGSFMCLSFHIKKHLKIGKGGMILTDDEKAAKWFKMARYEGRSEKLYHEDDIDMLGWNMYMTPQQAAHGLALMQNYPKHVDDLDENNGYRDLTEFSIFKNCKTVPTTKLDLKQSNKICFVLDTHYKNYTDRLKKTSLKSFIDMKLYEQNIDFLISTNLPNEFSEYKSEHIKVFDIEDLRKEYPISQTYEKLPESPYGLYPGKFPWNIERFILKKAGEMGYNYVINLDSDVVIHENFNADSLRKELDRLYTENTLMTNQAIFQYEKASNFEVFNKHDSYKKHFDLNYEDNMFNSPDGPVLLYMGKTNQDIINFANKWNELTEFGYKKEFGFGYDSVVCGNWSLTMPMVGFKLKWNELPFTPHHVYEDRYPHIEPVITKTELVENNSVVTEHKTGIERQNIKIQSEKFSIKGVELADQGYFINLEKSTDRNTIMMEQIEKLDVKGLNRFEALTDPFIQYSCTKSHLEVFRQVLETDLESIVVFEDDAKILEEPYILKEKFDLESLLKELKSDMDNVEWDVILLGCNPKSYLIPVTNTLSKVHKSTGGWAYIIKKRALEHIFKNSNYRRDLIAIDDWLPKLSESGFNVFASTPLIVHHGVGLVSTLQPSGPVNYTTWIDDNYYQFLYIRKENKTMNDLVVGDKFISDTTIVIPGYFCENFLFYLKYLLKSLPEELYKCKFMIIYDNYFGTKNPHDLIHYFLNRKLPLNYEIVYSNTGVAESMKIALEKIKTKYMIWLEHDAIFLQKNMIDFNKLHNVFENYNFVNLVWFNTDDNQMRGFDLSADKNGSETPYGIEERITELDLIKTTKWSSRPMMFRVSKMKEWYDKYIDNPTIGVVHQGQSNIEENMIREYKRIISENVWDEIKDDWGTFYYGKIGEGPYCGHTDASRRYQESSKTMAEENANLYIQNNPLTEND